MHVCGRVKSMEKKKKKTAELYQQLRVVFDMGTKDNFYLAFIS
jgi:hypothetical protein